MCYDESYESNGQLLLLLLSYFRLALCLAAVCVCMFGVYLSSLELLGSHDGAQVNNIHELLCLLHLLLLLTHCVW